MADRSKIRTYSLWIAIALVVLYVGAGGAAKLASVPYVHSSFPKLPSDIRFAGEMGTFPIRAAPSLCDHRINPIAVRRTIGLAWVCLINC
jgi:hypothetical protein